MIYLATYFDKNYLSRGLVLYDSLVETEPDFILYVLCLDAETAGFFNMHAAAFQKIRTISLAELESADACCRRKATAARSNIILPSAPACPGIF
jgi:hypothetical protein